ncbi:TetR/AcrR family transcriptional regulator [Streptomyces agglomeratus]|uniref:TetR/AcrR family transcriptional regulator n=1 Tax=Streptomyces agglomeratus TaxID=285458 RepID=UPI0009A078A6|nr:TetR/AcrR family transcriptional regulator [Streptomyces agglomeratus]
MAETGTPRTARTSSAAQPPSAPRTTGAPGGPGGPRTPDSTRRSERSRRAIYEAALSLVGEVGYPRTTIEGIAARAGVGKQTIYRWWPSKAAVLLEAFIDLGEQAARAAGTEAGDYAIPDTGDLAADLRTVLRATVDELVDPKYEAPSRALAAAGVVDPQLGAEFVEKLLEPQLQLYVERLRAAQETGDVRAGIDPRIALELLVAPLAHRWLLRTLPLTHAYADAIVDYALGGLAAR